MFEDSWMFPQFNPWNPGNTAPPVQDMTGAGMVYPEPQGPPIPAPVANAQVPQAPSMYNRASQDAPASMGSSTYGSDLAPTTPRAPTPPPAGPGGVAPGPGGQQAPQASQLANLLRGVQAPKPPDVQRVSTPREPHTQRIDPRTALLEFLSMMQKPTQSPVVPYSLGHALRG